MSMIAGGVFLAALVVTLAVADDETGPEAERAPATVTAPAPDSRPLPLRALQAPHARVVRDREHALRVAVPPGWRRSREDLLPRLLSGSSILTVATFDPAARARRGCDSTPDLPQTPIGSHDALLHVYEEFDAQPGNLPRRPRRFELREQLRRPDSRSRRDALPWRCLSRPGIAGFQVWFRPHGRLVYVAAVAGERTGRRVRRELLGIAESLRFGATPPVHVRVRPTVGRPSTHFGLELVSSHPTGRRGRRVREYWATVRGPLRTACVIENEGWFSHGPPGTRLRAVLDPTRTKGQRWCRGRFRGVVRYRDGICGGDGDGACHRLHIRRAGRFAFTVR
jgi:hypothetical protein